MFGTDNPELTRLQNLRTMTTASLLATEAAQPTLALYRTRKRQRIARLKAYLRDLDEAIAYEKGKG